MTLDEIFKSKWNEAIRQRYSEHSRQILARRARNFGKMTLFNGRKVSHELMTRYFRMLIYKLSKN